MISNKTFRELTKKKQKLSLAKRKEILKREVRGVLAVNGDDLFPRNSVAVVGKIYVAKDKRKSIDVLSMLIFLDAATTYFPVPSPAKYCRRK